MRTKKDIIKLLMVEHNLTSRKAHEVFQAILDGILDAVTESGRLELRNFGVFQVRRRAARMARNPRTNQPVPLPARMVLTFEPSRRVAEMIAENFSAKTERRRKTTRDAAS